MIRGEEVEGEKWLMREGTNASGGGRGIMLLLTIKFR
jgi:hypothetical protein